MNRLAATGVRLPDIEPRFACTAYAVLTWGRNQITIDG